jgi:hypothetical protein
MCGRSGIKGHRSRSRSRSPQGSSEDSIQVPGTETLFVTRLIGDSEFTDKIQEEHRCAVTYDGEFIKLRGSDVDIVKRRINGMFALTIVQKEKLLGQFGGNTTEVGETVVTVPVVKDLGHLQTSTKALPSALVPCVRENLPALQRLSGTEVNLDGANLAAVGTPAHLTKLEEILNRVTRHCSYGASATKVAKILDPPQIESVLLRLAPMHESLPDVRVTLTADKPQVAIGKDRGCQVVVNGAMVSRIHAVVELDVQRHGVYVIDASTNGTFLNGKKLPPKQSAKVLLSHGDELNLHGPEGEFGFMVNLQ